MEEKTIIATLKYNKEKLESPGDDNKVKDTIGVGPNELLKKLSDLLRETDNKANYLDLIINAIKNGRLELNDLALATMIMLKDHEEMIALLQLKEDAEQAQKENKENE